MTINFPAASTLGAELRSEGVETTKLKIFRRLWAVSAQEYVQQLARDRLAEDKAKREAAEKAGQDEAGEKGGQDEAGQS